MIKNKKLVLPMLVLVLCIVAFIWIAVDEMNRDAGFSEEYVLAEELPALLSFTYYDIEGWEQQIASIAEGKLSYQELEALLSQMGVSEYVDYEPQTGFRTVSRKVFFQIYEQLVDLLDVDGRVVLEERVFIGEAAKEEQWLTQNGYEQIRGGLSFIHPHDMYQVYTLDGAVIGMVKRLDQTLMWENVFVHRGGEGEAEVLFEKELFTIEVPGLSEPIEDTICDLAWTDSEITAIYKKEDRVQGTVLSYDEQKIEISGYGTLAHSGELKIYKTYGTVEQLDESKLMIGNLVADFVVAKEQVCGIILQEPAQFEQIRVLLLNEDSPYYPELYICSDEAMTVTFQEQTREADARIKVSEFWQEQEEGYLRVETATEKGKLFLADENGTPVSLGYGGSFEVRKYPKGYSVVNEISLEEYLCSVVPSEMPSSYEMEALRVQAICARSYACIQLANDTYAGFGANVDDSTNFQVYNKQEREERSTLAVQDTVGEVLKYQGQIAEAYYYSTSCGFSQGMEVWNQQGEEQYGYLAGISLLTDPKELDFSQEEVFAEFIRSKEYQAYDSDGPYYRWKASLDVTRYLEAVNQAVAERMSANASHVQILDKEGQPWETGPDQLGNLTGIQVLERASGGVLMRLQIFYEKGSILLTTEYNIRKILGAAVSSMEDKDGNAISSMTLLPSAAFVVEPTKSGYVLYGGGYGHGIGMSQNGANGMAKAGLTYTDILQKFYQNITIENIYNGQGKEE